MTGFRPIDELMKVADVSRQPPHVLFAENAQTTTRLSVDAEVNQLALNVHAGNAQHLSRGSVLRWADNTSDSNLTPEEREEEKRKEVYRTAMHTISATVAEFYTNYAAQAEGNLQWAHGERQRYADAIDYQEKLRADAELKAKDAEARLENAVVEQEAAETEAQDAVRREQNAENFDVLYSKDGKIYQAMKNPEGEIICYTTTDKDGNQVRLGVNDIDGLDLYSQQELEQNTAKAAEVAVAAQDNTAAIAEEVAKYKAYLEYSAKFEEILTQRDAEMEAFIQETEQEYAAFREDFNALKEGKMSEADFLAKYPDKGDRVEAMKKWQAQEEAFVRDQEAFLNGTMTEEQLKNNHAMFLAQSASRQERIQDRQAWRAGDMTEEEYRKKYPINPGGRSAARQEYEDKKESLEDIREASKTLADQRERLASDEVARRIESGEITFEQAMQEYGADPHFYNDFADRHGNLKVNKIAVAEVEPAQNDVPWYQSISDWITGSQATTQVAEADISATTPKNTTSTSLSSSDGQGIKDSKDLSGAFKSSADPQAPIVTAEAAPVVAAQQMNTQVRYTAGAATFG